MIGYNLDEQARLTKYQRAFLLRGVAYYTRKERNRTSSEPKARDSSSTRPESRIDPVIRARMSERMKRRPRRTR